MVQLHPHQEEAVSALGNGKVLWGGVGTGKSITAAAYYVRNEAPRDIYVITTAKKRNSLDWEKEFAAFAISRNPEATIAGVLTVDSWNNIGRYTDVDGAFFIFDEQRAVGSGAWADALIKIAKRNQWIMLSATPGDTWLDYIPLFVANGFYKNRTAFLREHAVFNRFAKYPKVDRFMGEGKLVRYKQQLLVEMPYERHTTRHIHEIGVAHDKDALERVFKGRWNIYKEEPLRDIAELFIVARKLVNSDPSRLEFVRSLLTKHPRLIVFYNFDYELEMLRTLASWNPHSGFTPVPREQSPCPPSSDATSVELQPSPSSTTSSTTSPSTLKRSETRSSIATSTCSSGSACPGTTSDTCPTGDSASSRPATSETDNCSTRRAECQNPQPAYTECSSRQKAWVATSSTTASAAASQSTMSSSSDASGRSSATGSNSSRSEPVPETTDRPKSSHDVSPLVAQVADTLGRMESLQRTGQLEDSDVRSVSAECPRSHASTTDTSSEPLSSSRRTDTAPSTTSGSAQMWNHAHPDPIASARVVESESGVHWEILNSLPGSSSGSSTSSAEDESKPSSQEMVEPASFAVAEWNGHKHQEVPTTDSWVYLVQYTAGAEGWNCVTTDTIVFFSLTYSYKIWHQAYGRIDRLNTPFTDLHYYVLQSNSWIDQAVRKSLSQKKSFNENRYSMKALKSAA